MLCFAHLTHAHWTETEIASRYEAENDGKDYEHCGRISGWQPKSKTGYDAQHNAEDQSVDSSNHICNHASEISPKERSRIENSNDLETEGRAVAVGCGVRRPKGQRDKDTPFHEKYPKAHKCEWGILENGKVGSDTYKASHWLAG